MFAGQQASRWGPWRIALLLAAAACCSSTAIAQASSQQQQQRSSMVPIINGWSNLRTTSSITFSWTHQLFPQSATSFIVPWGYGSSIARIQASFKRNVAAAQYSFSGNLAITNPDPSQSMWLNQLQVQCFWGSSVVLPCGNSGWQFGSVQIGPGSTFVCYVNNLQMQGSWGLNFRQPCKVIATSWNGVQTSSGDFTLDFNSPTFNNQANNCVSFSAACAVTPSQYYAPIVGSLPQNQLLCGDSPSVSFDVAVSGGFIGDGTAPGSCGNQARVDCNSQGMQQSTVGIPPSPPGAAVTGFIAIQVTPGQCPAPQPPVLPPPSPSPPNPGFQDRPEPQLSIAVTKTYIVGSFGWSVSSAVTPKSMDVFVGSTATAQYSVPVTRTLLTSPTPRYLMDGTITVTNPHSQPISLQSVSAVLPWNVAANAVCSNLALPGTLSPGARASCTFRMNYEMGPKPSSVTAQAFVTGISTPVLSGSSASFNFDAPDLAWSSGTCAGVIMSFMADPGMALALVAGGWAPAFAGAGSPATEVCGSTSFDFEVQFTPDAKFATGISKVFSKTTVTPTSGSDKSSREAASVIDINVLEWPATWDAQALLTTAANVTTIPTVGPGWYMYKV